MENVKVIVNDRQEEVKVFLSTSGAQGERGPQGEVGEQGIQGIQGVQGIQGEQGEQGVQGEQGLQGLTGDTGLQGIQGETGSQGLQGEQGIQGLTGDTGSQGIQGETGETGPQGIQGPQGETGADSTVAGPQGIQGIQGIQGEQGDTGSTGTGITFKGDVANVSSLPSSGNTQGDAYLVQSDDSLHIFDGAVFVDGGSIQGPAGAQGIQGIQGIQGPQGDAGTNGIDGTDGIDGIDGNDGADGADSTVAGPQGIQGLQGIQGEDGAQGIQGIQGETGATGADGAQGIQGLQGEQGIQGEAGTTDYAGITNKPSGTDNYVVKWDGTEGLQDSIIYDDGTNVGIGTTTPSEKLEVDGNVKADEGLFDGADNSSITTESSKVDKFGISANRGAMYITNQNSTGVIQFGNNGVHGADINMTISAIGNVGIGTTSPSDELHVIGDIQASQTLKALKFRSTATNASVNTLEIGRSDNNSYWNVNHAGNDFRLFNRDGAGTDILFSLDESGVEMSNKVGIGIPIPSEKLEVNGNVKADSFIKDGSTSDDVLLGDGTTTSLSGLTVTESNDLSSAVTWANVPDANITSSSVTQHEGDLTITESQISDLHTHSNKSTLDNFGEDVNGDPTYNGNTIDTTIAQRDVYDGLDSTDNTISLSANQGKVLKDVQDTQGTAIGLNTAKISFDNTSSTKLDGIETGAEVNVQSDWNATTGDSFILNKPTIPTVPTNVSAFTNDSNYITGYTVTESDVTSHEGALSIGTSQVAGLSTAISNNATVATNTAKVGVTTEEANTIDSETTGEPTGSATMSNIITISQSDYDAAVTAGTVNSTTIYFIQ